MGFGEEILEHNNCTCSDILDATLNGGYQLTHTQFSMADIEKHTSQKVL